MKKHILAALAATALASSANGALFTSNFTYAYTSGARTGISGSGVVTFDDATVPTDGNYTLPKQYVSVVVTDFGGQAETSGPFFVNEPRAFFSNGVFTGAQATFVPPGATNNAAFFQIDRNTVAGRSSSTLSNTLGSVVYSIPVAVGTPAVPEPATWAMMMLGFGGIGYALRRKAKVSTRTRFA